MRQSLSDRLSIVSLSFYNPLDAEIDNVNWLKFSNPINSDHGLISTAQWYIAIAYLKSVGISLKCDAHGKLLYRGRGAMFIQSLAELKVNSPLLTSDHAEESKGSEESKVSNGSDESPDPYYLSESDHQQLLNSIISRLNGEGRLFGVSRSTMNAESRVTKVMFYFVEFLMRSDREFIINDKKTMIDALKSLYFNPLQDGGMSLVGEICPQIVEKHIKYNPSDYKISSFHNEKYVLSCLADLLRDLTEDQSSLPSNFLLPIHIELNSSAFIFYFPRLDYDLGSFIRMCLGGIITNELLVPDNHKPDILIVFFQLIDGIYDAISFLHENGIYHRDLKFENILVGCQDNGQHVLKVADFGTAMDVNTSDDDGFVEDITMNGTTPPYSSPMMLLFLALRHSYDVCDLLAANHTFRDIIQDDDFWADIDIRAVLERNDWWAFIVIAANLLMLLGYSPTLNVLTQPCCQSRSLLISCVTITAQPRSLYDGFFYNPVSIFLKKSVTKVLDLHGDGESSQGDRFLKLCDDISNGERDELFKTGRYFR